MEAKDLKNLLAQSGQTNRSKYVPWWEDNFDDFFYKYDIFKAEEIKDIEACLEGWGREELSEAVGSYGFTLFHLLVWLNFHDAVERILTEEKVEADITDKKGKGITPFHLACCRGNLNMVRLLLDHGVDSSLCDTDGNNAYHYLVRPRVEGLTGTSSCTLRTMGQRPEIAALLSADVNGKNNLGMTPLALLLTENNTNLSCYLTDSLLKRGASVDYVDEGGSTLLLTAIRNNHMTAALLLMKDSDLVNRADQAGVTPMQLAAERRNEGLCMALKDHGAAQEGGPGRLNMNNLSRITGNTFALCSSDDRDHLGLALYLTEKLIGRIDTDDDDELSYILDIMGGALSKDEKCRFLDLCRAADIDLTVPIHRSGSATCIRDKCLNAQADVKAIKKLLELGVNMDQAVIQGKTPANIVASLRKMNTYGRQKDDYYERAAQFFSRESMEQSDNEGTTAIHRAVRNGHTQMLKVMIDKGVNVNLTEDEPSEPGNTPLHTACIYGNTEAVKLLLSSGADDTLQNINGETPAHLAMMKKKFGGDLTSRDRENLLKELKHLDTVRNDGQTPFMLLQSLDINTCEKLLPIFLERGVDINRKDTRGNTALIFQAYNMCFKDIVKELIREGADVNAANDSGNTALHYALKYGGLDVARYLIKKGADYNHANNQNVTPAQIAAEKGYDTVLELMDNIQ